MDASDNQVTVIGDGNTNESSTSGANGGGQDSPVATPPTARRPTAPATRPTPQAEAPIHATGNQVTVIGDGNVADVQPGDNGVDPSANPGDTGTGSGAGDTTSGEDGTGAGNQTDAGATAPVDASGNQVTVIGDGNTTSGSSSGSGSARSGDAADSTSGSDGTGCGQPDRRSVPSPRSTRPATRSR